MSRVPKSLTNFFFVQSLQPADEATNCASNSYSKRRQECLQQRSKCCNFLPDYVYFLILSNWKLWVLCSSPFPTHLSSSDFTHLASSDFVNVHLCILVDLAFLAGNILNIRPLIFSINSRREVQGRQCDDLSMMQVASRSFVFYINSFPQSVKMLIIKLAHLTFLSSI